MKRLILITSALLVTYIIMVLTMAQSPKPKAKVPNPRYSAPAISTSTAQSVQDFTVLINQEDMGEMWRGTGVLLDPKTVLTCAHIIPKDGSTANLWIYPYPGDKVVHAELKFINYPQDLALLELTTPVPGHRTPIFAEETKLGEPIVSVGNIKGYMLWYVSYGIISGEHDRWVLTDAMIRGGNSGGPWANARGEIVALTDVGWVSNDSDISGGIPAKELKKFIAHSKRKKPDVIYALTGK